MTKSFACALVLLLAACESAEKKAVRLTQEQAVACFEDSHPLVNTADQMAHDRDQNYKQTPQERQKTVDSLNVELDAERVAIHGRCLVATRDLNAFMSGR